jgi:uncharacterized protein
MTAGSAASAGRAPGPVVAPRAGAEVDRAVRALAELADDASVPRNVRRGALAAKDELSKPSSPLDVRIAGAVYTLDDLANDPNLPTHGRTTLWSIISSLESVQ